MTRVEQVIKSLEILDAWMREGGERSRWFDTDYEPGEQLPFVISLSASHTEKVRGHSITDAMAQAAQVVALNPELEQ